VGFKYFIIDLAYASLITQLENEKFFSKCYEMETKLDIVLLTFFSQSSNNWCFRNIVLQTFNCGGVLRVFKNIIFVYVVKFNTVSLTAQREIQFFTQT